MNFDSNEKLINYLQDQGLLDEKLKEAFLIADRKNFVPENMLSYAYQDTALPLFDGQTISQPTTVAFMLNLLDVKKGNNVLDIGAGSGWVSAILSSLCGKSGKVYAFEINETVGRFGKDNIQKSKLKNIKYFIEDASKKWREFAPYDRIHSGAGFEDIPNELKNLLKVGGVLVSPTQDGNVRKIERISKDDFSEEIFPGFIFVPFIKK